MSYRRRADCRVCGDTGLQVFLGLGPQPLANAFPKSSAEFEDEPRFPLDVALCPTCSLVQTPDVVDPETLFRDYLYLTGTSTTMAAHHRRYAADLAADLALGGADLVVEVASNDGSLLRAFQSHGVKVLGVEPARNVAARASATGIETVDAFFDERTAAELRASHGPARLVVANNVLAHVDDTPGFLRAARHLVEPGGGKDGGSVVVEVPYLGELLARLEYDTIYHEHLCYFSVAALLRAFGDAGLDVVRVDDVPVHGGSLRVHARPRAGGHAPAVLARAAAERTDGLAGLERYRRFAAEVEANRKALVDLLDSLKNTGARIAAYGAPAKGNTLLNYCRIGPEQIDFTVDKSPLKVGRFTPGMHLPVLPAEALAARRPDYCLVLAWNLLEEVLEQERAWREAGGRFIVPVPRPEVVAT